ncbi:MAG TPA: flavin reductase family protein [Candidatus Latescibacteria bacterium]|nr:MAG: Flavoredoxin [Candidatus Latescibacteria bacterium ADurb.Bin168]HPU85244.1 flavin reductase family protein [Candidatus Latescibacterota bacterium]
MAKQDIQFTAYLSQSLEVLSRGGALLVSTGKNGRPNVMTIGWGTVGWIWGKPIFCVLVRPSRYTHECLEATPEFTVNIPPRSLAGAVAYCGKVSGRDEDKFAAQNLTATPGRRVAPPVVEECVIHYECRVVEKNSVIQQTLSAEIDRSAYRSGDYHTLYFGEIVAVYADADALTKLA